MTISEYSSNNENCNAQKQSNFGIIKAKTPGKKHTMIFGFLYVTCIFNEKSFKTWNFERGMTKLSLKFRISC